MRQDQRVEELWLLMNDLLRGNALTSARGLRLETYQVVPMSMQLGLVEWVEVKKKKKKEKSCLTFVLF